MSDRGEYLSSRFGLSTFTESDREKLPMVNQRLLSLVEYHRGFEDYNNNQEYFLYTGRGPSQGSFHIGHLLSLRLIKNLGTELKIETFFMIADDEKILRDSIDKETMDMNVTKTIEQLNMIGFTNDNTKFHINTQHIGPKEYQIMLKLMSLLSVEQLKNIFGNKDNIGEYFYTFYQLVPCFLYPEKQCIVVCGLDQDPFFRLARYLAKRIGYKPPIVLYVKSVPGLDGSEKMSTSNPASNPIFINDSYEIIKNKIFSIKKVGAGTLNELFDKGANLEEDTLIQLARLFEDDSNMLKLVEDYYSQGRPEGTKLLEDIVPEKGFVTRNGKTMITTFGVRHYLLHIINKVLSFSS
jgi:tryptophanyl-tRNA synthetase